MRTHLATARLTLRPFPGRRYADELHEILADPLSHHRRGRAVHRHRADAALDRQPRRGAPAARAGLVRAAEAETGLLVGNCGLLTGRTGPAEPEIGYLVRRPCRGRGYATEAATAVVEECAAAGFGRVWASIRPHNTASRRIVERLGLRLDRIAHDERGELLFYAIDLR